MGLVVVLAVGLGGLVNPTRLWANVIFSLALAMIVGALVLAVAGRGWLARVAAGFAISGGVYLVLSLGPWFEGNLGPHLVTTWVAESGYEQLDLGRGKPLEMIYGMNGGGGARGGFDTGMRMEWHEPDRTFNLPSPPARYFAPAVPYSFHRIAHSLFAIVAGTSGAMLAWVAAGSSEAAGSDLHRPTPDPGGRP
jgi:hypothetical protein